MSFFPSFRTMLPESSQMKNLAGVLSRPAMRAFWSPTGQSFWARYFRMATSLWAREAGGGGGGGGPPLCPDCVCISLSQLPTSGILNVLPRRRLTSNTELIAEWKDEKWKIGNGYGLEFSIFCWLSTVAEGGGQRAEGVVFLSTEFSQWIGVMAQLKQKQYTLAIDWLLDDKLTRFKKSLRIAGEGTSQKPV